MTPTADLSPELDELAIRTIRGLTMDAVEHAQSGHPGTPMALAPLGWVLFSRLRRHDPRAPHWVGRDRFVLSNGHASMLQYTLLHLTGYDLPLEEIKRFRQYESRTPGHPEVGHTPGVESTTGPLGQGFGNAVGMAIAARHLSRRFDRRDLRLFDHRVWAIASDGDLMEGVSAEAASLAGHLRLGHLVVFFDDNRITIDGSTALAISEDTPARFRAYGWQVLEVDDANDLDALEQAGREAAEDTERPTLVRVRSIIGWPAPNKQGTAEAHGSALGPDELERTKEILGIPKEPAFLVPEELAEAREAVVARGGAQRRDWEDRLTRFRDDYPRDATALDRALSLELAPDWDADLPRFDPDDEGTATRKAGAKVLEVIGRTVPELVGGSADLEASNKTTLPEGIGFQEHDEPGVPRTIHWGVREHAMGSACNGMALHGGVRPFAATFLIFSDYMRPAIRLAALMGVPTRYVFTHDSIGLGEDGPTHQSVEQLASLRAIPGLTVIRPGDANEVSEAWRVAMPRPGPVALVLSRQNVPILDRAGMAPAAELARGGYVLRDPEGGPGKVDVALLATGSELPVAVAAADRLSRDGVAARVVSMPSWELFEEQDADYRDSVLPPDGPKVVVEAATRFGWQRWTAGAPAAYVTVDRFGASAPGDVVMERYGITPERVTEAARGLL
ncbi:MAG TPA: transketolase [Polyangiaceae bacterium LLY-WYZ-14_1]|nr:transketolase [Polyangiaceae bacterium LLY-WYZ-14_1]